MKAILIDPEKRTIEEVDKKWTLQEIQEYVGGFIENGSIDSRFTIYVDEEGLFKSYYYGFDLPDITTDVLMGKAVILGGPDHEGYNTPCPQNIDFFKSHIFYFSTIG